MLLLALDTSTSYASIALSHDRRLLAELTWEVGQRHSAELFDRLGWLLESARVAPNMLDGIAVATGPGSFNGTRVAVTAAKTLAFALGVPLYGHSTLDVIAWSYSSGTLPIWALLDAGRGQIYAAEYAPETSPARWAPLGSYAILTPEELAMRFGESALIAGEWREETRALLDGALRARAHFASDATPRRASSLADLASARAEAGEHDNPMTLEPLYLRKPAITSSTKVALPPEVTPPPTAAQGRDASHALHR